MKTSKAIALMLGLLSWVPAITAQDVIDLEDLPPLPPEGLFVIQRPIESIDQPARIKEALDIIAGEIAENATQSGTILTRVAELAEQMATLTARVADLTAPPPAKGRAPRTNIPPHDLTALGTIPPHLRGPILTSPAWDSKGHVQGTIEFAQTETLSQTMTLPARVGAVSTRKTRRGVDMADIVIAPDFVGDVAVRCLPEEGNTSANANFNFHWGWVLHELVGKANGLDARCAQISTITNCRFSNPKSYGLRVFNGSRDLTISGLDVDSKIGSDVVGLIIENSTGISTTGRNSFVEMQTGVFIDGGGGHTLQGIRVENVETGVRMRHTRGNEVWLYAELVTGPVVNMEGSTGGNTVYAFVRKTKNPHWIDKKGNKRELAANPWQLGEMRGQLGWGVTIKN